MKCEKCGALLDETLRCTVCGAEHRAVCEDCMEVAAEQAGSCPRCGKALKPAWTVTRTELEAMGMHAFMPYRMERNNNIYLGGNRDNGGYDFQNVVGYTGEMQDTIVLPGLLEGYPIYGIWNEFFCLGNAFMPGRFEETIRLMSKLHTIVVGNGIREAFTYAFFGCCGLERLILPTTLKTMYYDFYDLFMDGKTPMRNGELKTPVTIEYRGTEEAWNKVERTSRLNDYIAMGKIIMQFRGETEVLK